MLCVKKKKSSNKCFIHKAKQAVIARTRHLKHVCGALSSRLPEESKVHCITPTPSLRRRKKEKEKEKKGRRKRKKKKRRRERGIGSSSNKLHPYQAVADNRSDRDDDSRCSVANRDPLRLPNPPTHPHLPSAAAVTSPRQTLSLAVEQT